MSQQEDEKVERRFVSLEVKQHLIIRAMEELYEAVQKLVPEVDLMGLPAYGALRDTMKGGGR